MTIEERINELGEKYEKQKEINKELVDYNARLLDQVGAATKQALELEKKNAELKERLAEVNLNGNIVLRELTKAIELLNEFMRISKASDEDFEHDYSELIGDTEQFIKDSEVKK